MLGWNGRDEGRGKVAETIREKEDEINIKMRMGGRSYQREGR